MRPFYLIVLTLFLISTNSFSQEKSEAFKPCGKPIVKFYSNYHTTFSGGETKKAFELTRLYLGYEYFFSKSLSGKAIYDAAVPEPGKKQLAGYVKNAFLKYETHKITAELGLILTNQLKLQEAFWGRRYLLKSFQDEYCFTSGADLGVNVSYQFSDWLNADFAVYNGEGYKNLQYDNIFKNAVGITVMPANGLTIRGLYDWMGNDVYQQSWIGFVGYSSNKIKVAAEYNYQKNQNMTEGHDWYGPSFYATFSASEKIKLFTRFDGLSSKKPEEANNAWNLSKDGQLFVFGMEYTPVKGINIAPNLQGWNPADKNMPYRSTVFINCEVYF